MQKDALGQKKATKENNDQHSYSHLGFFLMSSNWPTTWDTFVLTILNAISSSPMISNLSSRGLATISNGNVTVTKLILFYFCNVERGQSPHLYLF